MPRKSTSKKGSRYQKKTRRSSSKRRVQKPKSLKRKGLTPNQKAKFAFLMAGGKVESSEE